MKTRIFGLALATSLSACVMPAPPPAVLSYAAVDCRTTPDVTAAIPLLPGKREGETVRTPVDATTPCLDRDGFRSPYLVYRMPAAAHRMIEVGGAIEQVRVFPPAVATLGANGETLRSFAPGQFQNRGDRYSVQFLPQEGERYILVTVDPALVGSSYDAVTTGTSTTYFGSGYWTSGVDRTVSRSRSYHGVVLATVYDTTG